MISVSELEPEIVETSSFRKGKITIHDVKAICEQVSETRCTEKDACIMLNINPLQWYHWKEKNKNRSKFDTLFTRIKQSAISGLISDIKDISNGDSSIKLKPDWRAKQFLLQVRAPERFVLNTSAPATEPQTMPQLAESLRRAFAGPVIDIDTTNVTSEQDKHQTLQIENQTAKRTIPPRKHKPLTEHPQQ